MSPEVEIDSSKFLAIQKGEELEILNTSNRSACLEDDREYLKILRLQSFRTSVLHFGVSLILYRYSVEKILEMFAFCLPGIYRPDRS